MRDQIGPTPAFLDMLFWLCAVALVLVAFASVSFRPESDEVASLSPPAATFSASQ